MTASWTCGSTLAPSGFSWLQVLVGRILSILARLKGRLATFMLSVSVLALVFLAVVLLAVGSQTSTGALGVVEGDWLV